MIDWKVVDVKGGFATCSMAYPVFIPFPSRPTVLGDHIVVNVCTMEDNKDLAPSLIYRCTGERSTAFLLYLQPVALGLSFLSWTFTSARHPLVGTIQERITLRT